MHSSSNILTAARALRLGCTLLYPTETVYGLGCLPQERHLRRVLAIKQRPNHKGMILLAARREYLQPFTTTLDENIWKRICRPQRRATTWLVPAAATIPELLKGQFTTVAIRITRHRQSAALSYACRSAIISTSANDSGKPPTKLAHQLSRRIQRRTDLILQGNCGDETQPSQIKDALSGKLIANRIR